MGALRQRPPEGDGYFEPGNWLEPLLARHWLSLRDVAGGAKLMPRVGRWGLEEPLGTGGYGAVFATGDAGVVFKVTSDASEAAYAELARTAGPQPRGIARHFAACRIPGARWRRRPLFALWREAAYEVGDAFPALGLDTFIQRDNAWTFDALGLFARTLRAAVGADPTAKRRAWARAALADPRAKALDPASPSVGSLLGALQGARGPAKVQLAAASYRRAAERLAGDPLWRTLGWAFLDALDLGVVLADVDARNVGVRTADGTALITDPGHMVWLAEGAPPWPESLPEVRENPSRGRVPRYPWRTP